MLVAYTLDQSSASCPNTLIKDTNYFSLTNGVIDNTFPSSDPTVQCRTSSGTSSILPGLQGIILSKDANTDFDNLGLSFILSAPTSGNNGDPCTIALPQAAPASAPQPCPTEDYYQMGKDEGLSICKDIVVPMALEQGFNPYDL